MLLLLLLRWGSAVGGAVGRSVVVAGGGTGADGAEGAAARVCEFEVADCVLGLFFSLVRFDDLVVPWGFWGRGERKGEDKRKEERRTAGQQNPPQQDSPATQNVLPQQVDPMGMQKGAKSEEVGTQHWTFFSSCQRFTCHHIYTTSS